MTNVADILQVGEKYFDGEQYEAVKPLFSSIAHWARLATPILYLIANQTAVESARMAGAPRLASAAGSGWFEHSISPRSYASPPVSYLMFW